MMTQNWIAARLILFHPDFYRRLWPLTRSADLLYRKKGALAGFPNMRDTAGGELHPALRISSFGSL
jgi:hypothetical protein